MSDRGIFDDLLGIARRAPDAEVRIAQLRESLEHPQGRKHPCARCSKFARAARVASEPEPPIAECERIVKPDGRVYVAGLCAACGDYEWSERWSVHHAKAVDENNTSAQRELTLAANEWQKRGRKFYGTTLTRKQLNQ